MHAAMYITAAIFALCGAAFLVIPKTVFHMKHFLTAENPEPTPLGIRLYRITGIILCTLAVILPVCALLGIH